MAKIDYTKYTFQELIDRIEFARFFDLPRMTREALKRLKALIDTNEPKYKVYTALLTQTGTDAPVATVLENTLGVDVVWNYDEKGMYSTSLIGEKAVFIPNDFTQDFNVTGISISTSIITLITLKLAELTTENEILNNTPIEIRVYN